jgi:hypothetical protein
MPKMTQQQKMSMVMDDPKLSELYLQELNERGVKYGSFSGGHKIGKKKVGIQKLILCQKSIAARIYDNHFNQNNITKHD